MASLILTKPSFNNEGFIAKTYVQENFPPERETVHFTIKYPLKFAFVPSNLRTQLSFLLLILMFAAFSITWHLDAMSML
ncbi:hypothetical protein K438DRAFT_1989064 [Mycena galopus ATCC 62051]|nr:hypothetical protein K438DRAFT_1989064 [Mycena galopus ATCC 62051]